MRTSAMRKMQVAVFVGFFALVGGWLAIHERDPSTRLTTPAPSASASAAPDASAAPAEVDGGAPDADVDPDDLDAGADEPEDDDGGAADGGLPELSDAPKAVRFGVILVLYKGAELAPEDARARDEAAKIAKELSELARSDFAEAVKKGDKGSTADAGRMYRGILEPDSDYALFSLEKGAVSEPIDTPRGFWIVKRLD